MKKARSILCILIVLFTITATATSCSAKTDGEKQPELNNTTVKLENTEAVRTSRSMPFNDIKLGKWYYDAVSFCYVNGYMSGTAKDTFSPASNVTRAMFVTILYKIDYAKDKYEKCGFDDVPDGKWYTTSVEWAYENGYASGVGNGRFSPNGTVTRQELCTFLYTYSRLNGYDVSTTASIDSFIDKNEVSSWAKKGLEWAYGNELISGTTGARISPKTPATRAMIAVICQKYIEMISSCETSEDVKVDTSNLDAVDSLGRVLSDSENTKDADSEKFVGLFYWTWHEGHRITNTPRVAGEIVKQFPDAVQDFNHSAWEGTAEGTPYFWGEPLYGFYSTTDKWVLRRHAELLADAGVDVIIFDCTNGTFLWDESTMALLSVFEEAREDGVNTPQIAFMLNFAANENSKKELVSLYDNIYAKGKYKDLWFYWEGKPLIMAWEDCLNQEEPSISDTKAGAIKDFFTFRYNNASYFSSDKSISTKRWGWLSNYPQAKYCKRTDGTVEQMCVSVAQNATDSALVAMNYGSDVHGRSYAKGDYSYYYNRYGTEIEVNIDIEDSVLYGINFQQQWDYALSVNPDFIFITGWNEWIAGRQSTWQGTENGFPDEFNEEYSRDIEPENGLLKDNYYLQMCDNIRKFKGVDSVDATPTKKTVKLSLGAKAFSDIEYSYDDYIDSEAGRDSTGHGGIHYTEEATRNDIISSKFAYDDDNLYFTVQTKNNITSVDSDMWMRLFITVGDYKEDSWEGFDYIINRESPVQGITAVEKLSGDFNTVKSGDAEFMVCKNTLVISVPRAALNIADGDLPTIRFKWVDNAINNDNPDIMDTYSHGDSAPNTRFMYKVG